MIHQLTESGMSQQEIASHTGLQPSTICCVLKEQMAAPKAWDSGLLLLDLYLKKMAMPPPRVVDGYQYDMGDL
jgi:hypothetical protein